MLGLTPSENHDFSTILNEVPTNPALLKLARQLVAERRAKKELDALAWERKCNEQYKRNIAELKAKLAEGDPFAELMLTPLDKNTDWNRAGELCQILWGNEEAEED